MLSALTLFYYVYLQEGPGVVTLHVISIDIEYHSDCILDSLTIYDGPDLSPMKLGKYCGNSLPPDVQSTGGSLLLHLHTNTYGHRNGFNVSWCKYKLFLIFILHHYTIPYEESELTCINCS